MFQLIVDWNSKANKKPPVETAGGLKIACYMKKIDVLFCNWLRIQSYKGYKKMTILFAESLNTEVQSSTIPVEHSFGNQSISNYTWSTAE